MDLTPILTRVAIAVMDGKRQDALSTEAFEAFRRRAKRDFSPSIEALLAGVLRMAPAIADKPAARDETDLPSFTAEDIAASPGGVMPLGAARATVAKGKYWEPAEDGPWFATLPIYEARPARTIELERFLRWQLREGFKDPKTGRVFSLGPQWFGDYLHHAIVEQDDCADAPEAIAAEAVSAAARDLRDQPVAIHPAYAAVAELVLWAPDDPSRWWLRTGALEALGQAQAELDLAANRPVRIYATPAVWNDAGAARAPGCCVLDWRSGWARRLLIEAKALVGDSIAHGEDLQRRVARTLPSIQVAA